jgi:putative transposase
MIVKGGRIAGSHSHAGIGAARVVRGENGAVHQKAVVAALTREFPELRKRYWGQHLRARGYFCATVGAVDEKTIREYIENQKWDEDEEGFKIIAPAEP